MIEKQYQLLEKVSAKWDSAENEYLKFDRVENKRSQRPDLHAMLLLEELFPTKYKRDMVCVADHDKIVFDVSEDDIITLSNEHIIELVRCGILYSSDSDCLFSFV